MDSEDLRNKFLEFFEKPENGGHKRVPSSPLIPDDPSVLLTTAGMQQFKPYYTGELDPMTAIHGTLGRPLGSKNAVSIQKSFRTSDIAEVGDESHLTFFEMLGNFSFGGYDIKKAQEMAREFIEEQLGLKIAYVSELRKEDINKRIIDPRQSQYVISGVESSTRVWSELNISNIEFAGFEENFWGPTGNEGPCGPTTEIYVNNVKGKPIEIWNLVFNEVYCTKDKKYKPLELKGIDTGMGLERLAMIIQKKPTIFETDLFWPIIGAISSQNPAQQYDQNPKAFRIISDHLRASVFLIAEGIQPSNVERGYILRRLLRRAARYAHLLGLKAGWYDPIVQSIIQIYRDAYPEVGKPEEIRMVIAAEYEKFEKALEKGLKEFQKLASAGSISGKQAFDIYQSYGFPIEVIEELAEEKGIGVDRESFEAEFKKHQEVSRAGKEQKFGGHGLAGVSDEDARKDPIIWKMTRLHTATHLLHQALRDVLGPEVRQMGSDINPERTRFDFTFGRKLTPDEIKKVEELVNAKIKEDLPVNRELLPYQEALKQGALAFFKEKYPETVSVYSIGNYSKELCGGPHVSRTGEIGSFRIVKEEAVSAGVRRIRGVVD